MDIQGISETTVLWIAQYRLPPDYPQWKSTISYESEEDALADFPRLVKQPRLERRIVKVTVEEVPNAVGVEK